MPELSYDELEASACGIYSHEPGPKENRISKISPNAEAMESRRISVPKLWAGPYTSRFRERFTPTPTPPCSSADEAEYETSPEDAESEYEECLPIPPKSELRNGSLGLPHNKNRGVQVIDNVFHGDDEIDGVDANIDLSLIDGSCSVFASHRNAGLPPVPERHPRRPVSISTEKDIRMRQDSSFMIPPLNINRRQSQTGSSNETLVDTQADSISRSSPKSATPPEHTVPHQDHSTRPSTANTISASRMSPASIRSDLATCALDGEDADDEADAGSKDRQRANSMHANEVKRLSSATRTSQLDRATSNHGKNPTALHKDLDNLVHHDEMDDPSPNVDLQDNQYSKDDDKFKAACALQRGKQSLDDKYLMDLMQVHPAVRMEAFKRDLHVPRDGSKAPSPEEQEKRLKDYRYDDLKDLVPGDSKEKEARFR